MKIAVTSKKLFSEITKDSDRYQCDPSSNFLQVKGEHEIKIYLHRDKESSFNTTLLFKIYSSRVNSIFLQISGEKYKLIKEVDEVFYYSILDKCFDAKEFIDCVLEAIAILDNTVTIKRIGITCD